MRSRNGDGRSRSGNHSFLNRFELVRLRQKALRRGVWYRVLGRIERCLVDLAIVTVRRVRSPVLARSVIAAVKKLLGFMESKVARQIRTIGYQSAEKLARIAVSWGHRSAASWATDSALAMFLAVLHLNTTSQFGGEA